MRVGDTKGGDVTEDGFVVDSGTRLGVLAGSGGGGGGGGRGGGGSGGGGGGTCTAVKRAGIDGEKAGWLPCPAVDGAAAWAWLVYHAVGPG